MKELIFKDNYGYYLSIQKNKAILEGDESDIKSISLKAHQSLEFDDQNKVRLLAETLLKLADWMEKK